MKKTLVLYKSKYGATKKYAHWIGNALNCLTLSIDDIDAELILSDFDTLIIGGGIYATEISSLSFIKSHYKSLKNKKLIFFGVGAVENTPSTVDYLTGKNFNNLFEDVPFFYFRGGWQLSQMSYKDKTLVQLLFKSAIKKEDCHMAAWEKVLVHNHTENADWTNIKSISPLVNHVEML